MLHMRYMWHFLCLKTGKMVNIGLFSLTLFYQIFVMDSREISVNGCLLFYMA